MTPTTARGPAIELHGLTKQFGDFTAVDDLSVSVERGGVVGLLGPNGAGKSTTIRMLLGLIAPTSGSGTVLGHDVTRPSAYMRRVGALVEAPVIYPKLSGRDNLRTLAVLAGVGDERIDEVLDLVDLTGRDGDRASDYSLGMKQRLAIAAALLKDPELVILDEPTNGLDPAGIVEIRELLIRLGQIGKTVIVSSHLLAEIQAACDRLIIIKRGSLVFEGATHELLDKARNELVVVPEDRSHITRLAALLDENGIEFATNGVGLRAPGATARSAFVNRLAFDNGVTLREVRADVEDLEDVFLRLTNAKETN
ncbi:MAG: ABC transporter ATP-binding protein [Acidimicrobiia bacterium]|jgi:ABC-2 type transport system ATP-binding protein|nr:ABC transporter ATP-binding protein [Acidimicrobiia bacterium]MBT8214237.1 ABC transporter ATP-binding protein [Acidimicrobiia bacterium]NNL69166.1 ABC transporter ATP-binding protein [Acidimicrobiia bacterium]RZV45448.1 MAG: ABC transporter ATP-binding protein [Acidimicrobiia bacterium]